jgi:hypothetical protein
MLAKQLADLPKEAAEEAHTIADLQKRTRELERELSQAKRSTPERAVTKAGATVFVADERAIGKAVDAAIKPFRDREHWIRVQLGRVAAAFSTAAATLDPIGTILNTEIAVPKVQPTAAASRLGTPVSVVAKPRRTASVDTDSSLPEGERKILIVAAQHDDGVSREQLTQISGFKRSTRDTYIQRLKARDYLAHQGELLVATDTGIAALGSDYEPLPIGDALREYWINRLPDGERKILNALADVYPESMSREALGGMTGYARSSRDTYLQRLRARKLIDLVDGGDVRAAEVLFG